MEIKTFPLVELLPYAKNTKKHPKDQIQKIADSIEEYGFLQPIVIDSEKNIIAGHGRYEALRHLGKEDAPCIMVENLLEDQIRAYRIMDNRTNESEWDIEMLKFELTDLTDLQEEFIDLVQIEDEEEPSDEQKNEVPDAPKVAKTQRGDRFKLGDHYLMCGDSTSKEDVEKLVGENKIDLLWTDPPYNVAYEGTDGMKIENDDMGDKEFFEFLKKAMDNAAMTMKKGACFYIAHADGERINFQNAATQAGLTTRQCLVWVKSQFALSRQDYNWKHEPILYGWKDGGAHYFCQDFTSSTVFEKEMGKELTDMKKEELLKILIQLQENYQASIIHADKPARNDVHPTMKPVELVSKMVENSSQRGDNVLDLFGRSGSTMIACQFNGRKSFTMEYDPVYADVIIKRWEELTGDKAEKM
jgi:DNA modification methylase